MYSVYASLFDSNLVHVQPITHSLKVKSRTIYAAPMAENNKSNYQKEDPSHSASIKKKLQHFLLQQTFYSVDEYLSY
jgi:hypothetical protein